MSAPDPKLWEEPDDDPEVLTFAYGIARRRALAELYAIREAYPNQTQALHDRIAEIEAEGEPTVEIVEFPE